MEPNIFTGMEVVRFNPAESFELSVKPSAEHRNPLLPGGGELMKVEGQKHEYKMLHLTTPKHVLTPETNCKSWNPSTKSWIQGNKITCAYYEVNEELCGDEFTASCMHNISSRGGDIARVMSLSNQTISPLVGALVVGLQTAIGSSLFRIGLFSDPNFGEAGYWANSVLELSKHNSQDQVTRFKSQMQKQEGVWTQIRRRAGIDINYVDTNNGTAGGNATLPANIDDFLNDLVSKSKPVLRFWRDYTGQSPVIVLQDGLFKAYRDYLISQGTEEAHRIIVEGFAPNHRMYWWNDYVVMRDANYDIFDYEAGMFDESTGLSKVQRAIFTVPQNLCLITNVRPAGNVVDGLVIQPSPLAREKGKIDMIMRLGIGGGITHGDLITVGYNSSFTYATS